MAFFQPLGELGAPIVCPPTPTDARWGAARVVALLERGFPWMRFPPDLEARYLRDGLDERLRHFLVSGVLALMVYNGFLLVDYFMARDAFEVALLLRLGLFTPVSLLALYLFSKKRLPWFGAPTPSLIDASALLGGLLAALSLSIILMASQSPLVNFYHVGFAVVITYGNVVQRLRFWYAASFTLTVLLLSVGCALMPAEMPARLIWPIGAMVFSVAVFTLSGNYMMERDERRRWLHTLRERALAEELTLAHARLQDMSRADPLTGLANRQHAWAHLQLVWEMAWRDRAPLSVLLIDIDHFKRYNERNGHNEGDAVLKRLAQTISHCLRRVDDLPARHGGESFMVVLPHTEGSLAMVVGERVRQQVEALRLRHETSTTAMHLTVSVGVASCKAHPDHNPQALLAAAEQALRQAKRDGRNRVCGATA